MTPDPARRSTRVIRYAIPALVLAGLLLAAVVVLENPPEPLREGAPQGPQVTVEVVTVAPRPFRVDVASYGTVQPRTRSVLVAQVSGQILTVAANFRDGGFFEADDVLLSIDPRDYEADVKIAEATLMDALQRLAEQDARAEQALVDWRRLGNDGEPSDLVLRKPQQMAAQAGVLSARSALTKARLSLERTEVIAPFRGRVLTKHVDVGQVVGANAELAEIYATDYAEIRLPLRNSDLPFVDLPEGHRSHRPEVVVRSDLGRPAEWRGRVVRTEGAIDAAARQLHVVAQIDDPFAGDRPLKIGEYVTATIQGRTLPAAIVIPNRAIYQGSYVYVVEEGILARREVDVDWQDRSSALIGAGLVPGEQLVLTPLGQVTSGIAVRIAGGGDRSAAAPVRSENAR